MPDIYILFDCPDNKNDKKWLIDELTAHWSGKVQSVSINETLSTLSRRDGIKGKLKTYQIMINQAKRATKLVKRADIVIAWSYTESLIVNHFLRRKDVKLISMNWLTPSKEENKLKKLELNLATNKNAHIIVNSPESTEKWKKFLGLQNVSRFHVIPDVYDTSVSFDYSFPEKSEKYCFTGGMNNRNWKMIVELARSIPDYRFVCVGLKDDFEKQTEGIALPPNLEVQYDIPAEKYYRLMNNAYLVLLPLLSKKVAGLINITRSAEGGGTVHYHRYSGSKAVLCA